MKCWQGYCACESFTPHLRTETALQSNSSLPQSEDGGEQKIEAQPHGVFRPAFSARIAALVRSLTWSLRKILARCILTVNSLMKRCWLISRFFAPVATS